MKKIIFIFLGIAFIFLNSCEDIVQIDLSEDDVSIYAVEATITSDENPSVFVYRTQLVNSAEPYRGISNAEVLIKNNTQPEKTIQLVESTEISGLYIPDNGVSFLGEPDNEYSVSISTGNSVITATELLAKVEPIDSIQVHSSLRGNHRFLGVFTYGNETPGLGNYYKWDVYINNELLDGADYLVVASDELVEGNYVRGFEIFTDFHDPNEPADRLLNLGDTVQVKQTSISSFAYYFYNQMFNQSQSGGMFSVPPANIESNFIANDGNEVLGIFTAKDVSSSNLVIIDENIESQLRD